MGKCDWDTVIDSEQTWLGNTVREHFTEGYCHALALWLHWHYGFGLRILANAPREVYDGHVEPVACHAFAIGGDGMVVDIEGKFTVEEMMGNWGLPYLYEDVVDGDFDSWILEPDFDTAEYWAKKLVEEFYDQSKHDGWKQGARPARLLGV
jgi:hypothetical protein